MADSFSGTSALTLQVQTAYDRVALMALRAMPVFAQVASVKPGNVTNPGNPVKFTLWSDLADTTATLTETVDVAAVALSDSQKTITPAEYGNAVLTTARVNADTLVVGFDADIANIVAFNMASSIDLLARAALDGGSTVEFQGDTTASGVLATDILTAAAMRKQYAKLAGGNAMPNANGLYVAHIHPDQGYDLRDDSGVGSWTIAAEYVNTEKLYNNEIGTIAGFKVIETTRCRLVTDGASGTVDLYTAYFSGAQALGEAVSIPPHVVAGPITDKLNRFRPLGWYAYLGFDTIREAALRQLKTASSIGTNT